MSSVFGWLSVGAGSVLLQFLTCRQATADATSQLVSGVINASIAQFINGLFNLPPQFDISSFL